MKPADPTLNRTGGQPPNDQRQASSSIASVAVPPAPAHPQEAPASRSGGQLIVDALKVHGVDMAFGVPGESYLSVLDALYESRDDVKFVTCRQ